MHGVNSICAKKHLKMFEYDLCLAFNQNEKKNTFLRLQKFKMFEGHALNPPRWVAAANVARYSH